MQRYSISRKAGHTFLLILEGGPATIYGSARKKRTGRPKNQNAVLVTGDMGKGYARQKRMSSNSLISLKTALEEKMKSKVLSLVLALLLLPAFAFAASTIAPSLHYRSADGQQMIIKLDCTAHTDGTFTSTQITGAHLGTTYDISGAFRSNIYGLKADYWKLGYYVYEAWAVNPASTYPTAAAAVTVTDEDGVVVIKSGELALSTSASGVAEADLEKFRGVNKKLTVAIGDTGSAANQVTIYLKLALGR